jgi:hypothetical protein
MTVELETPTPTTDPGTLSLIGLAFSNWATLENEMAGLLGCLIGLDWPVACAIMFTIPAGAARRELLKRVAIVVPCNEAFLIQLGRVLARIGALEERQGQLLGNVWSTAAIVAAKRRGFGAERQELGFVSFEDIKALVADITKARASIAELKNFLGPGHSSSLAERIQP